MEPKNGWDRQLKRKLDGLQPQFDPASWDELARRMDTDNAAGEELDQQVADSLRRVHPAYPPSSWSALATRLEKAAERRQAIAHYKAMELSLAFLLLLTLWQFFPAERRQPTQQRQQPIAQKATGQPHSNPATDAAELAQLSATSDPGDPGTGTPPADDRNENTFPDDRSAGNYLPAPFIRPGHRNASVAFSGRNPGTGSMQPTRSFRQPAAPARPIAKRTLSPDRGVLAFADLPIRAITAPSHLRMGFVGSPWDINFIRTPDGEIGGIPIPEMASYSRGYSGGIIFNIGWGKTELESGLIYAARTYVPAPVVVIDGATNQWRVRGFSRFELNTIEVPLSLNRTLLQKDRWRLYATTGASLNTVFQSNFYKEDVETVLGLSQDNSGGSRTPRTPRPDPLDIFEQDEGLIEGGSFGDNASLYFNGGFGVERFFLDGSSLFLQPTYQRAVFYFGGDGLGPLNDRIHSATVRMGMRIRIQ